MDSIEKYAKERAEIAYGKNSSWQKDEFIKNVIKKNMKWQKHESHCVGRGPTPLTPSERSDLALWNEGAAISIRIYELY